MMRRVLLLLLGKTKSVWLIRLLLLALVVNAAASSAHPPDPCTQKGKFW